MTRVFALALLLAVFSISAFGQTNNPTLFQKPTVNRTHIVFVYAGDLWIVPREGGDAKQLTTGVGIETDPVFSPDGSMVAFTGEYDGNTDVYVMPANGGVPRRLTYHPGTDRAIGWSPDGKQVLFASSRNSTASYARLFTIGLEAGGLPTEVPLPVASYGSFSADGAAIAYEPLSQWQPDWKRYKGGQTMPIWIARLSDSSIEKLPRANSNDRYPMWIGDRIYFLSDRTGAVTLFAYDTRSKKVDQLIKNDGLDFKSASAGPGAIAYEQFGAIHLYDLKSGQASAVNIRVNSDLLGVRPHFEKVGSRVTNAAISPTGARALFQTRGEILTVPAEKGDPRNLTNTTSVMERSPAWSPDGRWIVYLSDESGEYALHIRDQKGTGDVKKIKLPPTFYYSPTWSPDSRKIALYDHQLTLWYLDIEKGTPVKIDRNPIGMSDGVLEPVWSPDSKWIAYARHLPNLLRAIFIYSLDSGKSSQLTDGLSDARYPVFDRSGKYLYFTASTNLGPQISFADLSAFEHQVTRSVYAVVLRNDQPSPLAPESDEEKVQPDKKDDAKAADKPANSPADQAGDKKAEDPKPEDQKAEDKKPEGAPARKAPEPVRIDLDGIDQRVVALPIPARDYVDVQVGKGNLIYIIEAPSASGDSFGPPALTVHKYDLDKRKFDKALDGVSTFMVSANGEKALYHQGPNWVIAATASLGQPMPPGAPGGPNILKMAEMEVRVDPQAEWRQMYKEVWRGERDFFYDPNHHGLDLNATEKLYEPYLNAVAHRADLNYLFTEMLNNLTVGHMFIFGGDQPRPNFVPGGLLGCDYTIDNGRYRFARVYNGENWNPQLRAPLTQPGVNVKAGEYLLAVGGRELTARDNVYQAFESKAGKQVVIKVGPNPDGSQSREVTVLPVPSESGLRHLAWIEGNRRKVDQLSNSKLAYVYLPNTAGAGYTSFNRYFFAQTNKEGAVIDERFNGGGALADYVVQQLSRQLLSYIHFRYGAQDVPVPAGAIYGPKAMLINEMAGSGGDAMPWFFHKTQIGPLVGKRTWGGLVASFPAPQLMDGGAVTAPDAAVYGLNGDWEVENHGVAPDIEVEMDPAAWRRGGDPQLERAVEYLMAELKKNPQQKPKLPPFPIYRSGTPTSANK